MTKDLLRLYIIILLLLTVVTVILHCYSVIEVSNMEMRRFVPGIEVTSVFFVVRTLLILLQVSTEIQVPQTMKSTL